MESLIAYTREWLPLIEENRNLSPSEFTLRYRDRLNVPASEVAEQLECYIKAEKKFPSIHLPGMIYTRQSLEQATGEALLRYKQQKWRGWSAIDATGGLGMDTYALAAGFDRVIYIEPDPALLQIARHNHRLLGISDTISYINSTVEKWLENYAGHESFDFCYVDPSRRTGQSRHADPDSWLPTPGTIAPRLLQHVQPVVFKLSPMLDPDDLIHKLPDVAGIECCSVQGEVKELLCELRSGISEPGISAVLIDKRGQPTHRIPRTPVETLHHPRSEREVAYLYVPDAAVIKAGAVGSLACEHGLSVIGNPGFYMTGQYFIDNFPGNTYKIEVIGSFQPKSIRKELAGRKLKYLRIHRKNFPLEPQSLYSKLKIAMGDQGDLFFTRDHNGKMIYILAHPNRSQE